MRIGLNTGLGVALDASSNLVSMKPLFTETVLFNFDGVISPTVGTARWYPNAACEIVEFYATIDVTSFTDTTVELVSSGSTVLESVVILAGENKSNTVTTIMPITAIEYLTANISSGTGGADVYVTAVANFISEFGAFPTVKPIATTNSLGFVQVGDGLAISSEGVLRLSDTVVAPTLYVRDNYTLEAYIPSLVPADATVAKIVAPVAYNVSGVAKAVAEVAPTATSVFSVMSNGNQIGTITFTAGSTVAVSSITQTAIAAGGTVSIVSPEVSDTTLAGVAISVGGLGLAANTMVVGPKGDRGPAGAGMSAYQLAVSLGYVGTLAQWIASLHAGGGGGGSASPVGIHPGGFIPADNFSTLFLHHFDPDAEASLKGTIPVTPFYTTTPSNNGSSDPAIPMLYSDFLADGAPTPKFGSDCFHGRSEGTSGVTYSKDFFEGKMLPPTNTIECWIYVEGANLEDDFFGIDYLTIQSSHFPLNETYERSITLGINWQGKLTAGIHTYNASDPTYDELSLWLSSFAPMTLNQWNHVAFQSYSNGEATIYSLFINGVIQPIESGSGYSRDSSTLNNNDNIPHTGAILSLPMAKVELLNPILVDPVALCIFGNAVAATDSSINLTDGLWSNNSSEYNGLVTIVIDELRITNKAVFLDELLAYLAS